MGIAAMLPQKCLAVKGRELGFYVSVTEGLPAIMLALARPLDRIQQHISMWLPRHFLRAWGATSSCATFHALALALGGSTSRGSHFIWFAIVRVDSLEYHR
jgi:hypothetical protein